MSSDNLSQHIAELTDIVHELVETVRDQSRELQRLTLWLEQQTDLHDEPRDLSVEGARLTALLRRVSALRSGPQDGTREA